MFTLFYGLWKYLFKRDEFFVLILGLDNAGKTTLLEQAKGKCNPEYKMMNPAKITSTVGLNIGKLVYDNIVLNFWDLGGQEELQALWDKYFLESHAVIYVIDSSDEARLRESWLAFDKVLDSEALEGVPLLIACNKQDVQGCLTVGEIKTVFHESVDKIGQRDCTVLPVSALSGQNVREAVGWLSQCIRKNAFQRPPSNQAAS